MERSDEGRVQGSRQQGLVQLGLPGDLSPLRVAPVVPMFGG